LLDLSDGGLFDCKLGIPGRLSLKGKTHDMEVDLGSCCGLFWAVTRDGWVLFG